MKKAIVMGLTLMLSAAMLFGCGGGNKTDSTENADNTAASEETADTAEADATAEAANVSKDPDVDAPESGQVVVQGIEEDPDVLDPTLCNYANSSFMLQNLFGGLFRMNAEGQVEPLYSADYTVDETGTKYTFTLVDDAKWSDGTPLTAHDFEYSWKRVVDPEALSETAFSGFVLKNGKACSEGTASVDDVGVKAVDDKTLEVELEAPTTYFINMLATTAFYPVKKDAIDATTPWTKSASTYVSNGPFLMAQISPGEKYVLAKNPNYVKADDIALDQIVYRIINSQEGQQFAYMNDEIDITSFMTNEAMGSYKESGEYFVTPRLGLYFMDFQTEHKPFDDARVRKALALSIDRQAIITSIIQGDNAPAFGFVPPGIPDTVDPTKDYRDTAGNMFEEDVEKAKELLADAGYPNGEGFPTFRFITLSPQLDKDIAQAMQEMWRTNLGIECEIEQYESKVYWGMHEEGDFDLARDGYTGDYLDPLALLEQNYSEKQKGETRWANAKYDALIDENRSITDQAKRMENAIEAEKLLMDEMPNFPVYFYNSPFVCKPDVKGVYRTVLGHIMYDNAVVEG